MTRTFRVVGCIQSIRHLLTVPPDFLKHFLRVIKLIVFFMDSYISKEIQTNLSACDVS